MIVRRLLLISALVSAQCLAASPARRLLWTPSAKPPAAVQALFTSGEPGGIWAANYMRSMFQDAAMTIPAAVGMPVAKMLDLSGRGNTITLSNVTLQRDAAGRTYLSFNGSTSGGVTPTIDFTATDKMTVVIGVHKASDAAQASLLELSASVGNPGAFGMFAPASAAANLSYGSTGSSFSNAVASGLAAPITAVLTGTSSISTDSVVFRVNGAQLATSPSDQGTGNYGNYILYIGRRAGTSLPFNGRLYGLIVRGAASSAGQIADLEWYVNRLTGAY